MPLCAALLATAMLGWITFVDVARPGLAQRTDFLNSCYIAGTICARRSFDDLYPPLTTTSEARSKFSAIARQIMKELPPDSAPVWQYPPLDAEFFSIFTALPPQLALFVWQVLGTIASIISAYFLSRCAGIRWQTSLSLLVFFFPVFFTLKVGQQGLVLGVLPICAAMYLLSRKRVFSAGLIAAITLLTIKYFMVVALVAAAFSKIERRFLMGIVAGTAALIGLMILLTPTWVISAWVHSLQTSEAGLFDPHLSYNPVIYTSLSALLLLYCGNEYRQIAKLAVYSFLLVMTVFSLVAGFKICQSQLITKQDKRNIVFACAFYLMPVLQPHLLFYDLALLMPATILLWQVKMPVDSQRKLRALLVVSVMVVDLYFVLFAVMGSSLIQPLAFVLMLTVIVFQILSTMTTALLIMQQEPVGEP